MIYLIWRDGRKDSYHEINTYSSEMCQTPNRLYFFLICNNTFTGHVLTLSGIERTMLENNVTVVVNCNDVESPIPQYCKSDISECYFVEE